jgi:transposase
MSKAVQATWISIEKASANDCAFQSWNSENFQKKVRRLLNKDDVDIWSLDEVHFQQYGSRCRMWVPSEVKDPILLHHPTRKSVGFFGAVRLRDGKFAFQREEGMFDRDSFWSFLKHLRQKSCHAGRRVVVLLDNAKYHHALLHKDWRTERDQKFHCEYLPPYSPDLNPIERVWKLTRRLCVHNRYFPELFDIVESVEKQFLLWTIESNELRKLCVL